MTSSLDWAGLVPAVAAAAQAAAAMVQVYWDRRQRGARTTKHDSCSCVPDRGMGSMLGVRAIRVEVSVAPPACTSFTVVVLVKGVTDGTCELPLPPTKEYRLW